MPIPDLDTARRHSLWLARQLDSGAIRPDTLAAPLSRPLSAQDFADFADWQRISAEENEAELARQLRILRRHVLAHIMTRDLCRVSDLAEVTHTITRFADFATNTAAAFAQAYYRARYGTPVGQYSGEEQHLCVIAMGKAGGGELNVSSDLDLIFTYPESGTTNGTRSRSNQEFFTKAGQKTIALLDSITEDGQVFRIDMRLRPDGDSGALVLSETALEQYLAAHGREWERYAWCKARPVTPQPNSIAAIIRPFVFRKYLDYGAYQAMDGLHRQIRSEVQKRGMAGDIKLGAGGIREIEFIAQIFQMIRGGQERSLQLKGTQETLQRLAELGILPQDTVQKLLAAYRFLRETEHRLQYWDDRQTQTLPDSPVQQQLLAESMGFADYAAFSGCLAQHREYAAQQFGSILGGSSADTQPESPLTECWENAADPAFRLPERLGAAGFADAETAAARLVQMRQSSRYRHLSAQARTRFDAAVPQMIEAAAAQAHPDATLSRLLDFLESISRRSAYLAFLQQYPAALKQIAQTMSQSAFAADYLHRHPILLDEFLSAQLMQPLDWHALENELSGSLKNCTDTEERMDALRRFRHAQTFRLMIQDLAGTQTVETLSDELSRLADTVLSHTLHQIWQEMPRTHRPAPRFAIIGYGKLGGKELGYASDLDLVYLYDDPAPEAADAYAKLARRLSTWLSGSTGAGTLYDTDLRLRPNGESGFLAHSLSAFAKYQREHAQTWEHQALTRARFVCGDSTIGTAFEALRREILTQKRDTGSLKADITAMRAKIAASHPYRDDNVKYAKGGIVDTEFIVQYLVLAESRRAPELLENLGNIALLRMAAARALIPQDLSRRAQDAYRRCRQIQHDAKLRGQNIPEVDDTLRAHYAAVRKLWETVFGKAV